MHMLCMVWGCAQGLVRQCQMGPARKPIMRLSNNMDEFAQLWEAQRTAAEQHAPCALSASTQAACAAQDFEQTGSAAVCSAVSVLLDVRGH